MMNCMLQVILLLLPCQGNGCVAEDRPRYTPRVHSILNKIIISVLGDLLTGVNELRSYEFIKKDQDSLLTTSSEKIQKDRTMVCIWWSATRRQQYGCDKIRLGSICL
jgi:hypothetical protein